MKTQNGDLSFLTYSLFFFTWAMMAYASPNPVGRVSGYILWGICIYLFFKHWNQPRG